MATSFISLIPLFKHYDVWWSTDQFQSPGDSVDCILTLMESTRVVREKDCKRTNGEKRTCEWAKRKRKKGKDVHVAESKRARACRRKGQSFLGCWHTQSHSLQHRLCPKQLFQSDSLHWNVKLNLWNRLKVYEMAVTPLRNCLSNTIMQITTWLLHWELGKKQTKKTCNSRDREWEQKRTKMKLITEASD